MYSAGTPTENDYRGRQVCQAVANGADPGRLAAGGDDVEPAHRTLAVHDAIAASTSCYMPKNVRVDLFKGAATESWPGRWARAA
jgi:hypothetical protein